MYLFVIIAPLVSSSIKEANIFGYLVTFVVLVTFAFFQFAYISVFCFGGAIMSLYIVTITNRIGNSRQKLMEVCDEMKPEGLSDGPFVVEAADQWLKKFKKARLP